MSWVPLHVHSQFSILDAAAPVKAIAKKAAACGMPAVALTDHGNMHGSVDFYLACQSEGVKPLIGCEVYVAPEDRHLKKRGPHGSKVAFHLLLLAKNSIGYKNLCILTSKGYLEGFYYHPRIDKELLRSHSEGLICLSGCMSGMVAQAALNGEEEKFFQEIEWHHQLFGEDYYLEIQRHKMADEVVERFEESWLKQQHRDFVEKQEQLNAVLIRASKKYQIPLVATNDSHYMEPGDWQAHEILLNIQSGEPCEIWERDHQGNPKYRLPNPKRRVYSSHELYFKTPEEMQTLFSDLPEALSNTLDVAEKCSLELDFVTKHYPVYVPPDLRDQEVSSEKRAVAAAAYLRKLCEEGIQRRYTQERLAKVAEKYPDKAPLDVVNERLSYELEIIVSKGMCDYLLIVWDFIHWAKEKGIPVGPGRGSGAGSIILYLVGITDIEPLRFDLFFERFINPERLSYPDIDVDICMERRDEVIEYTVDTYGQKNVAQIITFGTMKAKMTIRDVGRVLSIPLSKVNRIAELVPADPNMTLEKALSMDPDLNQLYTQDEDAKRIIDIGKTIEGSIRNTGIHAAGVIISGDPLTNHIPLCLAKDSNLAATQYSMKPVEKVGMLKIDFLGLKTLTSIEIATRLVKETSGQVIDWVDLPLDDLPTYRLLHEGKTLGVFQMESGGMQDLVRQLAPDRFEEIIAIVSLYRPGPMEMIPSYINRKFKREPIEYDHPDLEAILSETYGIMVYQEQVMQIAGKLAGYSLGEGDILRRAMGKKDHEQMAKEREKFRLGALKNGIQDALATKIFDQMEKFASYGFNKSHAAAYGYIAYVTAFFKANYPAEWMAALMTSDRDDLTKIAKFLRECASQGIAILPPDVNEAGKDFVPTKNGIRFAMTAIKGVGEGVVEAILEERQAKGPFTSFYNFFERIDLKRVGKKAIESMVEAGCFDFVGWSRDALKMSIEEMFDAAQQEKKDKATGVMTLFSLMGEETEDRFSNPPEVVDPTSRLQLLTREKELLGFFLTGHPMDAYKPILKRLSCMPLCDLDTLDHQSLFRAAFIVESVMVRIAQKSGRKFAIMMISDGMESYELPIWPDLYEEKGLLCQENQLLYAVLQVEKRSDVMRLSCRWFEDLTKVDETMIKASDEALDRAKMMAARAQKYRNQPKKKEEKVETPKTETLKIDIDTLRFSAILQFKELILAHPGETPLALEFHGSGAPVATLEIDEGHRVDLQALREKLAFLPTL